MDDRPSNTEEIASLAFPGEHTEPCGSQDYRILSDSKWVRKRKRQPGRSSARLGSLHPVLGIVLVLATAALAPSARNTDDGAPGHHPVPGDSSQAAFTPNAPIPTQGTDTTIAFHSTEHFRQLEALKGPMV